MNIMNDEYHTRIDEQTGIHTMPPTTTNTTSEVNTYGCTERDYSLSLICLCLASKQINGLIFFKLILDTTIDEGGERRDERTAKPFSRQKKKERHAPQNVEETKQL